MKRNNLIHEELSACCIHVTVFLNTHFVICIIIIVGMSLKSNYNRANDVCRLGQISEKESPVGIFEEKGANHFF